MKYWILFETVQCPACGEVLDIYRSRMPLPKPKTWEARHKITDQGCYTCMTGGW